MPSGRALGWHGHALTASRPALQPPPRASAHRRASQAPTAPRVARGDRHGRGVSPAGKLRVAPSLRRAAIAPRRPAPARPPIDSSARSARSAPSPPLPSHAPSRSPTGCRPAPPRHQWRGYCERFPPRRPAQSSRPWEQYERCGSSCWPPRRGNHRGGSARRSACPTRCRDRTTALMARSRYGPAAG